VTASVGLATPEQPAADPSELIRDADTAMYRAKEQGRGLLQVFDEAARAAAVGRAHTEHQLRSAAERGELRLVYQPIFDLATDRVVGAEALLRWEHPHHGLIGPDRFISVAEDSGLILPIGEWVLAHACRQAELWAQAGSAVDIAVNVSPRQLANESLVEAVGRALSRLKACSPGLSLTLEVTETSFIEDSPAVVQRMWDLKALGARLAMDDFGTGYSSLANLRRLPVDILKIDRRFVAGMADHDDDGTIVRSIVALARSLGRTVVAEGVEDGRQLDMLRHLGCDQAQGYYLGRPQSPPAQLEELRPRVERPLPAA
jgi:EAL domain-containing protein (putative c-di-GMP-specific phosphodiesterase class I)